MRHTIRSQIFTGNYRDLLVVGTEGDEGQSADEVLRIHDAKLAKMGTDNLARGAIDSYRKRHFGTADPLVPGRAKPRPTPPEPVATKPEQMPDPPVADAVSRQQHADKLTADLNRLQADHNARVAASKVPTPAEQAAAAVAQCIKPPTTAPKEPAPSAPPTPTADDLASAITAEKQDAAAAQAEEVLAIESRVAGATERPHPDAKPEQAKAPAPQPAPSAPPTPEASTVATAPDAPQSAPSAPPKMGSGAVCEKCGAAVSASQAKLSQLFQSKTLCKKCMDSPGGSA